jgi:2-succinyl-5-enolpyruvyl-6-hydroxy-3-cyclohexene-1-carboxylate synthase
MNQADLNYRWGCALLAGLAASGVRRVVVSPGSRSTPLTLAALRHPAVDCRVVLDERSAAFFALGLAKAERTPAAVIATSGSAVANWYPAVVEADLAKVPLVLLSADRPPELQACGANQTMDQIKLFAGHVRHFHQLPPAEADAAWLSGLTARAIDQSLAPLPGPVHLNVPFREPLVPASADTAEDPPTPPVRLGADAVPADAALAALEGLAAGRRGVIVCGPEDLGDGFAPALSKLAARLGVPVLADALSGLRFSGQASPLILAHPDAVVRTLPAADWVLRIGPLPVTRGLTEYLQRCRGRPQVVLTAHGRAADPLGTASHWLTADPLTTVDRLAGCLPARTGWAPEVVERDRRAAALAEAVCADERPFEGSLLRALAAALPEDTVLFLGNSLPVRAAEWFAGRSRHRLRPFGNRGLSGIDGNLSTFFGVAAARGRAVAVVGDLTFQHDLGGLRLGRQAGGVIVVLDNGGGGIFDHLPHTVLPEFDAGWLTPQEIDMAAAARAFGVAYCRAATISQAVAAVAESLDRPGAAIVHVPIDRGFSLDRSRSFFSACNQGA